MLPHKAAHNMSELNFFLYFLISGVSCVLESLFKLGATFTFTFFKFYITLKSNVQAKKKANYILHLFLNIKNYIFPKLRLNITRWLYNSATKTNARSNAHTNRVD